MHMRTLEMEPLFYVLYIHHCLDQLQSLLTTVKWIIFEGQNYPGFCSLKPVPKILLLLTKFMLEPRPLIEMCTLCSEADS